MSDGELWDRDAETFDEPANHGLADPGGREITADRYLVLSLSN